VILLKGTGPVACMLQAESFIDVPRPPRWSFALKNLLVTGSFPFLEAYGSYDASHSALPEPAVQASFASQSTPLLPDPYVSDIRTTLDGGLTVSLAKDNAGALAIRDISLIPRTQDQQELPSATLEVKTGINPPSLLDLSSKTSQFGVAFAWPRTSTIKDLYLSGTASQVGIMALPAVQWEPVITDPNPHNFPSPLEFFNCGPNTLVVAENSVTLVPVVPRQAIDSVVSLYQSNPSSDVVAQFTLPFGLVASAKLSRLAGPLFPSPSLSKVSCTFSAQNLQSADQISVRAPGRRLGIDGHLPTSGGTTSIAGSISLQRSTIVAGVASTTTVMDDLSDTFDATFNQDPRVPVTRVDISGFGESLFSDWRNPASLPPTISKVALDVILGRTSKEVVQASSILYPYGVAVVRQITIERLNTGQVVRHDSGWQAVSDGQYKFPTPPSTPTLVTHPGLVKSVAQVRNIRELGAGQMYTLTDPAGNIELMPVKFDCSIHIENMVAGGSSDGVSAVDQLGYVQITKLPGASSLSALQYSTLLQDRGPLGGPVDCVTNIGNSGLPMRILHVHVGVSKKLPAIEFVMAGFGTPILHRSGPGGQWAFVLNRLNGLAPENVDAIRGVPLIQQNATSTAVSATQPYRFADPADLLLTDTPATDYGILFSTSANRVLFLRPQLKPFAPFQISSTVTPLLADMFALSTSTGPFPPLKNCIPITDPAWNIAISTSGQLKLQLSAPSFQTTSLRRVLRDNPNLRSVAYTSDEQTPPQPSTVTLAIDSASSSWACKITNLSLAMKTADYGEVLRVVGSMDSSSASPPSFSTPKLIFGPKLGAVTKLVSFLQDFGLMPPLDLAFGSVQGSELFNLQKALAKGGLGPVSKWIENFVIDMDFKFQFATTEEKTNMEIDGDITFKLPLGVWMLVWIGAVALRMTDSGNIWQITLGVGYGYNIPLVEPLEAYAYAAVACHITIASGVFGFGASVLIKADIDLVIAEASLTAEMRGDILHVTCGPDPGDKTIWGVGQVRLALEITLFLVADIDFDYQHEWSNNMDHGPCPLPDVV
jgi:hypothetical protein